MEKRACQNCGRLVPVADLDCKPQRFAGLPFTVEALEAAIDSGEDFTHEECRACYGPAFTTPDEEM